MSQRHHRNSYVINREAEVKTTATGRVKKAEVGVSGSSCCTSISGLSSLPIQEAGRVCPHAKLALVQSAAETLTKALAQIGLFVNKDFGRDHVSKRHKHLQKILVPELLWQVVDEQIGALWPYSNWIRVRMSS